jgi:hypothetical protein
LDEKAELDDLDACGWEERYSLEEELTQLYRQEELYWQRRGWSGFWRGMLTLVFSQCGKWEEEKQNWIPRNWDGQDIWSERAGGPHLRFLQIPLWKGGEGTGRLASSIWQDIGRLDSDQKAKLVEPFSMEEIERAIKDIKTETTPGPDGFPVVFYKKLWGVIKWWVMQLMEDFNNGNLTLSRLNYGIIVLIPKIREVVNIR